MTMIFETEHQLWLDAICQNQNLGKNLLAEKTLLADQRQCQYGWVNDINTHTPTTSPMPVYEARLFELAVIDTILWKITLSERYQHQQPAHVKFDCSSELAVTYRLCTTRTKNKLASHFRMTFLASHFWIGNSVAAQTFLFLQKSITVIQDITSAWIQPYFLYGLFYIWEKIPNEIQREYIFL